MEIKWIGAILLVVGFGYIGFSCGASYKNDEALLRQLTGHIEYMICELQYRQTPLPQLCECVEREASQPIRKVFQLLRNEIIRQSAPDANGCMKAALEACTDLPKQTRTCLAELGRSLGRFDLEGQVRGLEGVLHQCGKALTKLETNRDQRIRGYQVFGLCAGATLAIILI